MKTYKTIFYQLWLEIIRAQAQSSEYEVRDVLQDIDEKAKKLEEQVCDEKNQSF